VKSVVDGGTPVVEATILSPELEIQETSGWIEVELEAFGEQTTGMYYTINLNGSSDPIYDGQARGDVFNVKAQAEDDSSSLLLIVMLLVIVIAVLGTVVLFLARRGGGGSSLLDDEYEDEDEAYADNKVLAEIPADVDPEMARAMQQFPQWTQEEIQGYFDQGWNIDSLKDWVDNQ
jgi:hypothetical protein